MRRLVAIKKECDAKLKELEGNGEAAKVSQSEIDEKLIEFYKYGKAWKERRGVLMEMISKIWQESNEKPEKILTKIIGGETDKENGENWEKYREIFKKSRTVNQ